MVKFDVSKLKQHKKKFIVAGTTVAVLTGVGLGGNYYVQAKEMEEKQIQVAKKEQEDKKMKAEQKKLTEQEEKQAEENRKAEEERLKAEEQAKVEEEAKKQEELKQQEQAKQEEEAKQQEEAKKQEEVKKQEEAKSNEQGEPAKQTQPAKQGEQGKGSENPVAKGNTTNNQQGNVNKNQATQEQPSKQQVNNGGNQEQPKQQPSKQQPSQQPQQPSNNNKQQVAEQPQGTPMTRAVANSGVGKRTDQIVAVVAQGSSAKVTFLEKKNGQWEEQFTTNGFVGSQGVGQANESVSRTPRGAHSLGFAFGTSNPGTNLPFRQITPNSYWISNVNDDQYNTWQERESSSRQDEHLINETVAYKYGIVINYNTSNPVKGGGSGFFLHVSNGSPTAGCVSVPQGKMVELMQRLHGGAYIVNVNSINEISNY